MEVVPHLTKLRATIVGRVGACRCLIKSRTRAADVWRGAVLLRKCIFERGQGVCGGVRGLDAMAAQPGPGRQAFVVHDNGLEEVNDILVLAILGSVAGDVKGGIAGRMLGKLVLRVHVSDCDFERRDIAYTPEAGVRRALRDPVGPHVLKQIVSAKCLNEGVDARAIVGRNHSAVGEAVGCIWRWRGVVLSVQVTVLGV